MYRLIALPFALIVLFYLQTPAFSGSVTIDFEGLPDSTILTNQYPGLTFTNAIILSAGIGLNEFELPPHSGTNVAFDNNGPISILFDTPVTSIGGYFTYVEPLTLLGFDASNTQVASAFSAFNSNDALFGDPGSSPNEFLSLTFASGISSVTITGDPGGGSFALDDLTYSTQMPTSPVPEPNLEIVISLAAACLHVIRRQIA